MSGWRVDGRGRVDRARRVGFWWDERPMTGFHGDTLASALLASGERVVARSFKYHRPRGVWSAGSEEPNALVTVARGGDAVPNCRATLVELHEGLEARGQNAWPDVRRDLMAVNDLLAPVFAAGFYYKTFMWPRKAWERLYEPAIRRAAGLGALSGERSEAPRETAFAHCDLLVIGAGPAGLMAALAAARAGADVILADEGTEPGGRLLAEVEEVGGRAGHLWARETARELVAAGVRVMTRTTVTGRYDGGTFGALERWPHRLDAGPGRPVETFWRIVADAAVLATGATERGIAFPGNDRPGVMQAGAVRAYLNRWGVAAGRRVVVFGTTDEIGRTARDLSDAGVEVVDEIDARDGREVVAVKGRGGVASIEIREGGRRSVLTCDALAVAGGWDPAVHLACHLGGRPAWRDDPGCFVAEAGGGLWPAGAAAGDFDTAACLAGGARAAAEALGRDAAPDLPDAEDGWTAGRPRWEVTAPGRAWLDLQNDVTTKDVRLAAQENYSSVEHMKRYTTQGMAPDQGRSSNVAALAVLAAATGRTIPETGTTTFRPPFTPVPIAAMGAGGRDRHFAPYRVTPAEPAIRDMGAPMVEAGLWHRPSYVPRPGEEGWQEICAREVTMVREAVGVADVSTLGKIEVVGADAARFLDFVYANRISTLAVGRVRYGLMLREDGHVLDDGTVARLDEDRFLVTTTTAAAGPVMRHMEFCAQVLRPDRDVGLVSVTDHWAQTAVTGPRAAALLQTVLDEGPGDLPFMGWRDVAVGGIAGRLYRISFSGEIGYEIALPARWGESLFRTLAAQAGALGGGVYGMEALNVLRIEKGFPTHAEMDGRTTAGDLGLGRMLKAEGDFVGRAAAGRPGLVDASRPRLVGLRANATDRRLPSGALLFDNDAPAKRGHELGWVSSSGWSPTVGATLALAFVAGGADRMGDEIRVVDRMRGIETWATIAPVCAVDPEGERMRG